MTRFYLTCLVFLISLMQPSQAESLRLGMWNTYNYGTWHRWIDGKFVPFYPKPESEKSALRQTIITANLDLIFLQELESENHLKELQRDLKADGETFSFLYACQTQESPRLLGILSKRPLRQIIEHNNWRIPYRDESIPMSRIPLEWEICWDNQRIRFLGLHLKSRYTEHSEDPNGRVLRNLEWRKALNYLEQTIEPTTPTLLWGDLNSPPGDTSLAIPKNVSKILPLNRVKTTDPNGEEWTYEYYKTKAREIIDQSFFLNLPDSWNLSGEIHGDAQSASDHRLIVIAIQQASIQK